jgi:lipoyl synthase
MSIESANEKLKRIGVVVSGQKYTHIGGFKAIKDGMKSRPELSDEAVLPKPDWLRIKVPYSSGRSSAVKEIVDTHRLSTVCESAKCPNLHECWDAGTATIMVLGDVCTRACRFCSVDTGNPGGWLDPEEPLNSAKAVQLMGLSYVVITSVDRDDLEDGGAFHYAETVREILRLNPGIDVEVLTPDFQGNTDHLDIVLDSGIKVFAQNVETVKRLTHPVRDAKASYEQTLDVLAYAKRTRPHLIVKTSLMLGLGETDAEIEETLDDLKKIGVDVVTFGQYLRPTLNHLPVKRYVTPAEFQSYRESGLARGFLEVVSGPLVRSSYRAERMLHKNNCDL